MEGKRERRVAVPAGAAGRGGWRRRAARARGGGTEVFRRRGQRGRRLRAASVRRTWRLALRSWNAEGGVSAGNCGFPLEPYELRPAGRAGTSGPAGGAVTPAAPGSAGGVRVESRRARPAAEGYPEAPRRGAESRRRNISDQLEAGGRAGAAG